MSPEQLARLASPEAQAACDLLHELHAEQLVAEILADDARCSHGGRDDGGEVAAAESRALDLEEAALYVASRLTLHVSRGWHLVSTNVPAPDEAEAHRRLAAVVEAARRTLWHRMTIVDAARTVCGLSLSGSLVPIEGEEVTGIAWPHDPARTVRYTTRPEGVTCEACKPAIGVSMLAHSVPPQCLAGAVET